MVWLGVGVFVRVTGVNEKKSGRFKNFFGDIIARIAD